jgi:hypothetical protein
MKRHKTWLDCLQRKENVGYYRIPETVPDFNPDVEEFWNCDADGTQKQAMYLLREVGISTGSCSRNTRRPKQWGKTANI